MSSNVIRLRSRDGIRCRQREQDQLSKTGRNRADLDVFIQTMRVPAPCDADRHRRAAFRERDIAIGAACARTTSG